MLFLSVARPTVYETAKAVAQKFIIKTRQENGVTIGQVRDLLVIVDSSGALAEPTLTRQQINLQDY